MATKKIRSARQWPAMILLALSTAFAPGLVACGGDDDPSDLGDVEDFGLVGPFTDEEPLGKADSAYVTGPKVNTNTSDTQVWSARNKWEDTDTPAAKAAGIAWPADSGLNWDEKYALWVDEMVKQPGNGTYYETFTLTTPWGKTVPAPKLECAELAIFLRVTFAAWYELPFFMTSTDGEGTRVYFGHFGARTATSRYKKTPLFAQWYKDYSGMSASELEAGWPQDATLRERGLYGGGDEMEWLAPGAVAGTYFDEVHLNKRVGHFLRIVLSYFGSMHLASARNAYNLKPEAVREGDVLVERWQRQGIGHTLVVKEVDEIGGGTLEAHLVSGSMPRRQPKWETGVASKNYFTDNRTGGVGESYSGEEYAKLGGGLKRWRVTKNINGNWTNTWMKADEASWISDTDYDTLSARPAQFESLLGEVSPQQKRDALLALIEDKRNHLRQYPASCSARIGREEAFDKLYAVAQESFGMTADQVDAQYRTFEDYVFAELEYEQSKTCCWNNSTAAMFQIAMEYNQSLQANACTDAVVFKATAGGYDAFATYAEQTGRGHLWKAWSEDESCPQRDQTDDVLAQNEIVPWCDLGADPGTPAGGCADDGFEENDSAGAASQVSGGNHAGLMVCSGDDDFYRIVVPTGSSLSATVSFDAAEGDLDVDLTRDGSSVDSSTGTSGTEAVSASSAGTYVLRVYGYQGAQAGYDLTVSIN